MHSCGYSMPSARFAQHHHTVWLIYAVVVKGIEGFVWEWFINPWHIHDSYGSRFMSLCFCVRVCYWASCYIHCNLFIHWKSGAIRLSVLISTYMYVLGGFRWKHFVQRLWQHWLITSAFFDSWPALMINGQRTSNGFLSRRLACRTSDSSYNSSLVTVDYQCSNTHSLWPSLCVAKLRHIRSRVWSCWLRI